MVGMQTHHILSLWQAYSVKTFQSGPFLCSHRKKGPDLVKMAGKGETIPGHKNPLVSYLSIIVQLLEVLR